MTLGIARLLAQGLGFVQFAYFLHVYGSSVRTDALIIAQTIPYLLSNFFNQALSRLWVPVFLHLREEEGEEEAWKFTSSLITLIASVLVVFAVVVVLLAPYMVALLAPGFTPQDRAMAAALLRWMSVLIVVNGMCGPPCGLYYSHQAFTVPAVASLFPSIGIIAGVFLLKDRMGIFAFVAGGIGGSLIQLLLLSVFLNVGERRLTFRFCRWHRGLRDFLSLLGPRFLILGLNNVNAAVDRVFASTLGAASVSALGYAHTVSSTPFIWLRSTFGTTILPVFSADAARGDIESLKQRVRRYMQLAVFLIVPTAVVLMVLAAPLVRTLFQRGAFHAEEANMMATAVLFYSIGLIPGAAGAVLAAGFLSFKDTMTPCKVSCVLVFLNLALDFLLVRSLGLGGLALATSLVLLARLILFALLMQKRTGRLDTPAICFWLGKIGLAGACMALMVAWSANCLGLFDVLSGSSLRQLVPLAAVCLLGGGTYLLLCRCLGVSQAVFVLARAKRIIYGWIGAR